jgi:hypothetical protein
MPVLARHNQQQSPIFKLPPELRNRIYEMVYEQGLDPEGVNADEALTRKPSSALMRSCQTAHAESQGLFNAAFQRFWREGLVFNLRDRNAVFPPILSKDVIPFHRVHSFRLVVRHGERLATVTLRRTGSGDEQRWVCDTFGDDRDWAQQFIGNDVELMNVAPEFGCYRLNIVVSTVQFNLGLMRREEVEGEE